MNTTAASTSWLHRHTLLVACALFALSLIGCDGFEPDTAATDNGEVASFPLAAKASDETCRGTIGARTFENLKVPDGAKCTLEGTIIKGNLFVYTRSTLIARGVRVGGNIQADGARSVTVNSQSDVGGNIQIKQGYAANVAQTTIDGDVQLESNDGPVYATRTRVGGNMQVFQNTGGVTLRYNRIAENLQCKENTPRPTGGGNIAGDKEDQCAKL